MAGLSIAAGHSFCSLAVYALACKDLPSFVRGSAVSGTRKVFASAKQVAELAGVSRSAVSRTFTPGASVSPETRRRVVEGSPGPKHVNTSYVERMNLSIRMQNRRFTRLTNAFSKKLDNHIHALALYFAFYNFCRIHKSLKVSPAMAAGITDRLWSLEDIVSKMDKIAPAPKPRGPYKTRTV